MTMPLGVHWTRRTTVAIIAQERLIENGDALCSCQWIALQVGSPYSISLNHELLDHGRFIEEASVRSPRRGTIDKAHEPSHVEAHVPCAIAEISEGVTTERAETAYLIEGLGAPDHAPAASPVSLFPTPYLSIFAAVSR